MAEFGIDFTDSVFNLCEVYFMLFEYGEPRIGNKLTNKIL